jgi:DtxR family Mn-dependent transcriptional regulator
VLVRRIGEEMQKDELVMAALRRVGALPDKVVVVAAGPAGVLIGSGGETAEIDTELAAHLFVHRL